MRELFDMAEQHYRLNNRLTPTNRSCPGRLRQRFRAYTVQGCMGVAISHYMADRLRAGRTPETVNRDMNVLRAAFRLGYQHDLVTKLPVIKKLPELTVRNEFFTRGEIDALLPRACRSTCGRGSVRVSDGLAQGRDHRPALAQRGPHGRGHPSGACAEQGAGRAGADLAG